MAQKAVWQTHLFPNNQTSFAPGDGRSYAWTVGKSANRPWNGPGLDSQMYGNLIQTDDPTRPTWWMRKAFMIPSQGAFSYPSGNIRVWNIGHQTGGGVGYGSGYATSQLALDIFSSDGVQNNPSGAYGAWDGNGVHHTNPYFQRSLNGGGAYQANIDWYAGTTKHYEVFEFSFDVWYYFEVQAQIFSDGSGFWTEKINGSTWINHYTGPLHLPGVSTSFYPNNAGTSGFEIIEGAYEAAGSTGNQRDFILFSTQGQYGTSQALCIADTPTTSLGDHSYAISGSGQSNSFTAANGTTIDDAGFGGGTAPPTNTAIPTIGTSQPVVGVSISETDGTWTGSPTFTRQWQSSGDGGTTWADIAAATSTTYSPVSGDVGKKIRIKITGTNGGGTGVGFSSASASVAAAAGGAVTLGHTPASGTASVLALSENFKRGNVFHLDANATLVDIRATLRGSTSTGTQPVRAWIANSDAAGNATSIVAFSSAQTISSNDLPVDHVFIPTTTPLLTTGYYLVGIHSGSFTGSGIVAQGYFDSGTGLLRFQSDTFADGTDAFTSPGTGDGLMAVWATLTAAAPAGGSAPTNSVAPTITGTVTVGFSLNCSPGTWAQTPAFSYQWQTSANGTTGWTNIVGASQQTYTMIVGDAGKYLRCSVTGTNSSGSLTVNTAATTVVLNPAPVNTLTPILSGNTRVLGQLTATQGNWDNFPTVYGYQWQISTDGVTSWTNISGATGTTYSSLAGDLNKYVRIEVVASNNGGATSADSEGTRILPNTGTRSPNIRVVNPAGRRNDPTNRRIGEGGGV